MPMMDTVDQVAYLFNELSITTTTVLMLSLTDATPDNTARYQYGWVLVGFTYLSIVVNIVFIGVKFVHYL